MQLHFRIRFIAAIAIMLFFASCSKSNKQGRLVPKDAGFVMHWNSKSLSGKINMNELKQSDWYKQITEQVYGDSNRSAFMKKITEFGKNSGVETLSDFIFFVDNSGTDGMHLVVEAGLKDPKTFESFLKNIFPTGSISKEKICSST